MVYSLVGNGWTVWSWGTTRDVDGVDTGMDSTDTSCVLSGVSGDLSKGEEPGYGGCGTYGLPSEASTWPVFVTSIWPTDHWTLVAHGGACGTSFFGRFWYDNAVNAQATCFWKGGSIEGYWIPEMHLAIHLLQNVPTNPERMCLLAGLRGVDRSWNNPNTYARLRKVTVTDSNHPTAGWYVESNLQTAPSGSHPLVHYMCIEFPSNHIFTSGTTPIRTTTQTIRITSGSGIKACALTGIQGAFNVNSWSDGITMNWPSTLSGDWTLTVSAGKSASWVCVR